MKTATADKSDISRRDIIYADLQLPKSSNDGSLRKVRHEGHLPLHDQRHLSVSNGNEPFGTEYAEIKLLPKVDGQVDIWGTYITVATGGQRGQVAPPQPPNRDPLRSIQIR